MAHRINIKNGNIKLRRTWACFQSLAQSKLRLYSANHRPGYWSNLPCDWPSTAWACSKQETENGPGSPGRDELWPTWADVWQWWFWTRCFLTAVVQGPSSTCPWWGPGTPLGHPPRLRPLPPACPQMTGKQEIIGFKTLVGWICFKET